MPRLPRSVAWFLLIAALSLAAAHALDHAAYARLYNPRVYDQDWGRMLRTMGYLPFWWLAALALALQDGLRFRRIAPTQPVASAAGSGESARGSEPPVARRRFRPGRAGLLFLAPMASGLAGEVLKLVIRRERPWAADGAYVFRSFSDRPFSGSGLAMPSSHTVVAFGAAFALARLFPRAAPVWYILAAGCAFTRVAARAHFLSDVVLGVLVAWVVVALLWRWMERSRAAA